MCGICGFYGFEDKNVLKRMVKILLHRGPDDRGFRGVGIKGKKGS